LADEISNCFKKLNIEKEWNDTDFSKLSYKGAIKNMRQVLRTREYSSWCNLTCHGKGVKLYQESPSINKSLFYKDGLTCSEWISYLKMIPNVSPCRAIPGRSQDGTRCRRCNENFETLSHILGYCPFGLLLRNHHHHHLDII